MKKASSEIIDILLTCSPKDEKIVIQTTPPSTESILVQDEEIGNFLVKAFKK